MRDVVRIVVGCKRDQPSRIALADRRRQLLDERLADFGLRIQLVHEGEDNDGRMVEAVLHHQVRLLDLQADELGIRHLLVLVAPAERLLPHENARLVAEVEEALARRIVRQTDEVAAKGLDELDVLDHHRLGRRRSRRRMHLVPVHALQEDRLAVQLDPPRSRLHLPYAKARTNLPFSVARP